MVATGRSNVSAANVVKSGLPILPYAMQKGQITWSQSYDGETRDNSGSIVYEGIVDDIDKIINAYPLEKVIDLRGCSLEVTQVGYTRDKYVYRDTRKIETFKVTISLRDPDRNRSSSSPGITFSGLNRSLTPRKWNFFDEEILTDGENTIGVNDQGYNEAELTWGDGSEDETGTSVIQPTILFVLKEPVRDRIVESSDRPTEPPENTFVLRDTSSCYDRTGEKKVYKESFTVDGTPDREVVKMYGFDYTYSDINAGDGILYSASPGAFWKQISYQETRYIYRKAESVTLSVTIPGDNSVRFVVHPDFTQFASIPLSGGEVTLKSNAEYLVEVVTTGWNLHRLKEEDQDRNSLFPDDPYFPYFFSKKVPFYSRTAYLLKSARSLPSNSQMDAPFRTELQNYDELDQRIKNQIADDFVDGEGRVLVLYPDPNFVEPLYIARESSRSSSFTWAPDPEGELDPDKFIEGTNIVAPVPRLMTGQESSNDLFRLVTGVNRYTELISEYSSQDPGFDNAAERISFKKGTGDAPSPNYRLRQYEQREITRDRITKSTAGTIKKYYVSTGNSRKFEKGGSVSFPEADSLNEALDMLRDQLANAGLRNNQQQKTIAWFYPEIRGGDVVRTQGDRFSAKGDWVVTNVSWNLKYEGTNNKVSFPLVTTTGTQLTLGLRKGETVSVDSKEEPAPSDVNGGADVSISFVPTDTPGDLGKILPVLPNRRNF